MACVEAFFRDHNVRRQDSIELRIDELKAERPLTTDAGAIEPARLVVELLLPQRRAVCAAIERYDDEIAKLASTLPDFKLFDSPPGAGPVLAPRLLVAFGERRDRLYRCWIDRAPYDESRYLEALKKHTSPLLAYAVSDSR